MIFIDEEGTLASDKDTEDLHRFAKIIGLEERYFSITEAAYTGIPEAMQRWARAFGAVSLNSREMRARMVEAGQW